MDARGRLCFGIAGHARDQRPFGQRIDRGFVDCRGTLGHVTMEKVAGESAKVKIPMASKWSPHAIWITTQKVIMAYKKST